MYDPTEPGHIPVYNLHDIPIPPPPILPQIKKDRRLHTIPLPPPSSPILPQVKKDRRRQIFAVALLILFVCIVAARTPNSTLQSTPTPDQAMQDANQRLANDLSSLQQDSDTLAQFSESNTFQGYAKDWKQMQYDYATEQQLAQQGCGPSNSNQRQVSADANQVDADDNQISADNNQFSADKTQYDRDTSPVQTDIQNVQNDWAQLQQAVANNPSGAAGAAYTASDIQSAINQGNKVISTAQGAWESAQSNVSQYDQQASTLQKKADALPGSMNCN